MDPDGSLPITMVATFNRVASLTTDLKLIIDVRLVHFGPRVYPKGSLVIALVRVSVRVCVRLKYRDCSLVFSSFLHEVRAP